MLIAGLLIGAALGFVLQRGRFCVTGAFRDVWIAKNTWWLSAFFVAIAVQTVGIWVLNALGVITLEASAFPWLATIVGGFIFGFGIVLAGARHHLTKLRMRIATLPPERTGLNHLLFEKARSPFATAVMIGLIAIIAWPASWATGRESGLGITTPSANITSYLATGDVELVDWGVFPVLGILIGSFIAAKGSGEFKLRVPDAQTIVRSIGGGALMGVGAAWAGGCTIGNALVATAAFEWQGWVSFAVMILGTGVAAKLFIAPRKTPAAPGRVPAGV